MKELSQLKESFEAPAQWFQVLKSHLKIEKGALLLPDLSGGIFSPWILSGFDRTTYYRLRIPASYLYNVFHRSPTPLLLFKQEDLQNLSEHFSSREFGLLQSLLMYGIFYQEQIIGVLILSESSVLEWDLPLLDLFFTVIDELTSPLLYAFRSARQEKLKATVVYTPYEFKSLISKVTDKEGIFFTLDSSLLEKAFKVTNPEMDPFPMLQDLATVISNMLEGLPVLIYQEEQKIYFYRSSIDRDLFTHQLEAALKHVFPELSNLPSLGITSSNSF
ncbi:MAG: hypothetical protein SNJ78_04620 [Spirochaetales bacterium]